MGRAKSHSFLSLSLSLTHTHTHTDIRILLAQLSVLLCLGTESPSVAEALAADPVHLAATPSFRTQTHMNVTYFESMQYIHNTSSDFSRQKVTTQVT